MSQNSENFFFIKRQWNIQGLNFLFIFMQMGNMNSFLSLVLIYVSLVVFSGRKISINLMSMVFRKVLLRSFSSLNIVTYTVQYKVNKGTSNKQRHINLRLQTMGSQVWYIPIFSLVYTQSHSILYIHKNKLKEIF